MLEQSTITFHHLTRDSELLTEENQRQLINFDYQLQRQHQQYYRRETRDMTSWLSLATIDELMPRTGGDDIYGIFSEEKMIGYFSLTFCDKHKYGVLSALYIHTDYRGSNIGMAVVSYAEELFRKKKYTSFILRVSALNRRALSLYKRHDFRIVRKDILFNRNVFRKDNDPAYSVNPLSSGRLQSIEKEIKDVIAAQRYHPQLASYVDSFLKASKKTSSGIRLLEVLHRKRVIGYCLGYQNGESVNCDVFIMDRSRSTKETRTCLNLILASLMTPGVKFVFLNISMFETALANQADHGIDSAYFLEKSLKRK